MPETPAMEELARDPSSRKRFLKMVGGAGATGAFAMFLAACGSDDNSKSTSSSGATSTASTKGDLAILNYALTLEYLEADFYQKVIESGEVKDKKIAALATKIGENEKQHVDALKATIQKLGGKPVAAPTTTFDAVIAGGPEKILATAASVENLGAAAYLGQAGRITSPEVLAAALSIHSVEARHAAALNTLVSEPVTPDGAFAKPAAMAEVLKAVKPFIAN
jgi:rubrerythrin